MLLDPLSLPSRMNLGSVLEAHLGMAAHGLGCTVVTPGFNGATVADIEAMLVEAGLPRSGMFRLADGRTGRLFDQETTVGYVYIMKLEHLVEDKCQARNTGHYLPDTEQPASGRRHHGGQRIGLMETWALQGHGAARVLQEMLTLKSDDVGARAGVYEALAEGTGLPEPTVPHSVRRLVVQLRGLCLDLNLLAADGRLIDVFGRDAAVDNAVVAMLELAPAERILAWSAGEFPGCPAGGAVQSPFRQAEGLALRHLVLAIPVQHPWRGFVANLPDQFPAITVLPVLPSPLCPGSQFDRLYAAVIEANDACRSAGHGSGAGLRLQEAVDQLLNALTRCLHGKQGWITAAISGKTVDYSARSVICPGPGLDYDTCSLPEAVAAVLFEPLVVGALVRGGQAASAAEAKERLAQREPEAMAALRRVAGERCVILHRAPVLHRLGMQAFRVRLAAEHVIRVHPLPLVAFNGDFDGDEMDAFLPLGEAAQAEAWATARSSRCQLSPANGTYVAGLTQDMVLGCFYATGAEPSPGGTAIPFQTIAEVATAHEQGRIGLHETIAVAGRRTTVGRALFNQLLPPALGWLGVPASKAVLQRLIEQAWRQLGADAAAALADALMRFGFHQATLSGMSLGKDTFRQFSGHQACLDAAWHEAAKLEAQAPGPAATDGRSALVSHWLQVVDRMGAEALGELAADRGGMNPLHLMLVSGARGSRLQVRQHLALRGLMALPDNRIFSAPVTTSFIRGHSPFEYFAATFGARRGLADTAVKTADAGFLFKRIMNAVQDIVVGEGDCGCEAGVVKAAVGAGAAPWLRLAERIAGRTALRDVRATTAGAPVLVPAGTIISTEQAAAIEAAGVREVAVRSPVTCQAPAGVCAACYGLDLATWQLPQRQQAIGVLAAQSIGEPATQLTMRTFHPGAAPGQSGKRDDILGGLPQIDRLFECWQRGPDLESPGYRELVDLYQRQGPVAAAEHLLVELQRVYRQQGVRIDDRHFEVVLRQMLRQGLRGVTTVAAEAADFIAAGTAYGGIPALARAAARKQRLELTSIRNCTAFGKPIPAPGRPALAGQP
jgi:DNA-directed RNA polymerase beta' subunit